MKYDHGSVEEYPTKNGPADYILFFKGIPLACVEGKKVSIGPQNVLQQAKRYARGFEGGPHSFGDYHLPFAYSTNGKIFWFQDLRDPVNLSREVAEFHTPEALMEKLNKKEAEAKEWLKEHKVDGKHLWPFQIEAITAIEQAILSRKRHMMVAMATSTGKTFTIFNLIYRLMKSGYAKRILFLVDRRALAAQAVTIEPILIHPDYILRFLQSSYNTINTNPRGIGIPHVEPELFWNLEVPLAPLAEQKRIVAKVEELLARVNATKERLSKVSAILKRFRQVELARREGRSYEAASELLARIKSDVQKEKISKNFINLKG